MSWGEHQLIIGNPVASSQTIPEASASCAPDRILPDFNCYACILGRRFYLFVAEAKSPHSSNITYNLRKLAKAMKRMMDTLVGFSCHTYAMDLEYDDIYRMAELDHFHLLKSVADLVLTKHTIECLLKIKVVVTRTLVNINKLKSGQLPANPKYQHHQRFVNCEQSKVRKTKD